jgi:beta-lactamase class A
MLPILALAGALLTPDVTIDIQRLIAASGADVAVAFRTLDGREELLIQPDLPFHAASTMKVPVLIELFRQARAGTLSLDDRIPVVNQFHSIVDGSPFTLDTSDGSDAEVAAHAGRAMSYRELAEAMITVSSNFAANLLIERVGAENVRKTVTRLGADGMVVLRGVEDQKAFDKGMNNSTTARALGVLMQKLATGKAVNAKADAEMVAILKRQKFNDGIPAGLPAGTPVAHKTGSITKIHHDAAIVYGPHPYVLVVLTRGIEDQKVSAALMASISREVWSSLK